MAELSRIIGNNVILTVKENGCPNGAKALYNHF